MIHSEVPRRSHALRLAEVSRRSHALRLAEFSRRSHALRLARRSILAVLLSLGAIAGLTATASAELKVDPRSDFSYVNTSPTDGQLQISFLYDGGINPIVSVGTGPNVFQTEVNYASAHKVTRNLWAATVVGLKPGTSYWYRIDNLKTTHVGRFNTRIRDVLVDFYQIDIIHDGDSGPRGCGDFYFTWVVNHQDNTATDVCLDDGATYPMNGFGDFRLRDWKENTVPVEFWALDNDNIGQPEGIRMTTEGDLAYGFTSAPTSPITQTSNWAFNVQGEGVSATIHAHITVTLRDMPPVIHVN